MFERLEKMDRRAVVALVLAIGIGLLIFGGVASGIRQAGWNEGFLVGLLSNGGAAEGGQALNPYLAARGYGMHGWGWHPFWVIGGFFRFLFFGFVIMMLFRFFAFRRWGHHGGYGRGPWRHHAHQQWGPYREQGQADAGAQPQQPAGQTTPTTADRQPDNPQPTNWTQV
ncbi:MAG: hypothetical protein KDE58_36045 [Caldilineaceae bacterium]|nr:hypothetical protein [Caldilineaceae bacterium]